jgi:imidazolonepropionase
MNGPGGPRRGAAAGEIGLIEKAALAVSRGKILWSGPEKGLPSCLLRDPREIDLQGRVVTPGFVDSHTHPLFGSTRQGEYAMRAAGADYEEIAAAGGGILNSVRATRAADDRTIEDNLRRALSSMLSLGTTTLEAKSGYGLDGETEIRCLRILARVASTVPQTILRTFLGAHALPAEYAGDPSGYLSYLGSEVLPEVAREGLADFVDVFCEKGVFTPEESRRHLRDALDLGFRVRIHADEFHDTGGAGLAVELGAMSADHLLSVSPENVARMASSDTVATLLPGTALFLNKPFPPGRALLDAGAAVALASDYNPGSCFCESMPFMVSLAVCACGFTVEEALVSATANGAAALGLSKTKGALASGMDADFIAWNLDDYRCIPYHMAVPDIGAVFCGNETRHPGERIF